MLKRLAADGEISVLLIEQNLGVAIDVADTRRRDGERPHRARSMPAAELAADRDLQQRLLGVRVGDEDEDGERRRRDRRAGADARRGAGLHGPARGDADGRRRDARRAASAPCAASRAGTPPIRLDAPRDRLVERAPSRRRAAVAADAASAPGQRPRARVLEFPVAATSAARAYVAGTFDTKGRELFVPAQLPRAAGRAHGHRRPRDLGQAVAGDGRIRARWRATIRSGARAVFTGDRGSAVTRDGATRSSTSSRARRDLGGLVSAGGSGGTALATPAMRALPIGVPKVMVSTVASGDVRPYVGPVRHLHDVLGRPTCRASTASPSACSRTPRTRSPA